MKKLNFSINEARAVSILTKTLSVAEAAKILDVSSNALNISISRIEQKINKTLFERKQKTGEVTIMPGVDAIIDYMHTISDAADLIDDQNKTWTSSATSGQVVLSSTQTIIEYMLGHRVVEFINKNPHINVSLKQQDDLSSPTNALNEICIATCAELEDGYEYFPYHSFMQRYWASPSYLERFGCPQSIEDLFHHRVLLRKNLKDPRMLFASMPVSQIFPNPQLKTYEVYGARIVDFLCEQGLGIMAAAEETVKLSKLKVEQIFSDERSDHIDVFVRVNKEFLKTPIAQYFIDWIFECRDEALHSIGIAPSFAYTKLSGKKN